ncbi:tetratricopeptide repeat-containing sulfotransferase family protein [Paremcibacter congregatus]|uniref:Sulfotransferase family protein n=1 Tax=Paremcibacter congregatus TaxID=2043170 RepID=A0A2G4YQI6_9PROT|nr:sulfotransferase [Paremcibacter congregatus]PHZ84591.1 sulfotransferase family protein [Paremcibacter congregatus]QDE28812.1 tetratricopeptide repeat protein [Paremcibacter congregatus]
MHHSLNQINQHLKQGQVEQAEALCSAFTNRHPTLPQGWLLSGRICQAKGDLVGMLSAAQKAVAAAPTSLTVQHMEAEATLLCGQLAAATKKIYALEKKAWDDARMLQHTAQLFSDLEHHTDALRCYQRARHLIGENPELLYNTAATATALGDLAGAEDLYNRVIAHTPDDYAAYYNRATLKKQTAKNNHIAEMEALRARGLNPASDPVQLGYALAKEYEDIKAYDKSFAALREAADTRRKRLSYSVTDDIRTMADIAAVMTDDFFADIPAVSEAPGPIFILGQPRSGSTLVDRILSSHSDVESLGEINDFVHAFMNIAGPARSKADLIQKTAKLDCAAIGTLYQEMIGQRRQGAQFVIDKTPANFLYIGLIAKALPTARIIHLRRHPLDNCYAMYKTLFQMGYPYSYALDDLGAYYIAYHRLMAHWRAQLPGRIHDVDYEALVTDQKTQSKRLVAVCGLDWQDACLNFHENKSASATASAAQVRHPIYTSSVEKWRHYETQLAPLKAQLAAAGIDL